MAESLRMVFWVIFYLILIIGLFFIIIKFLAQKNKHYMAGRSIKTIGGVALGQNKSLQVVEIGHTLYVVGVGEDVQLISKIEDPEEVEYIRENFHPNASKEFPILQSVNQWFSRVQTQKGKNEELSSSFQQVFNEKMGRLANRKQKVMDLFQEDNTADRLNDKS